VTARGRPTRLLAGAGLGWGVALLIRPRELVARLCPEFPESRVWVVRVLGARIVAQNAVVLATPRTPVARSAAVVDAVHAASMLPLLGSRRYRRAALVSGGVAAAYAGLAARAAGGSRRR
jgi:hypothetical protein